MGELGVGEVAAEEYGTTAWLFAQISVKPI